MTRPSPDARAPVDAGPAPLRRATEQGPHDLRQFYGRLAASTGAATAAVGRLMLAILPRLDAVCAGLAVWGLTSHARLWLLAADDHRAPWLVGVGADPALPGGGGYVVRYRMPDREAPWPHAIVEGEAPSAERAAEMVRVAMLRSRGWPDLDSARPAI